MKTILTLILAGSAIFLSSNQAFAAKRLNQNNLERSFAQARKKQLKSVGYELGLSFQKGESEYSGKVQISVEIAKLGQPLSIDWEGQPLKQVAVNGKTITDYKTIKGSVEIPAKHLKQFSDITIEFSNHFGKEGAGIQRVVDPEDKHEYIYTDFEPYAAHEMFPCFDQPDLKAKLALTITAPTEWTALGNELPLVKEADEQSGLTTTKFIPTRPLSTYLYFAGAGPFTEWKSQEGKIPLVIYARKSLAKYVDSEKLFETSKKGLRFFSDYLGYEYPFSKFGLVFVPEFSWSGMENPGAITLNERNLFRGPVPNTRMEGRDSLILHEMAHMWFGDLVTMEWWNDLWLNESFATYMATVAQDRAFGSKMTWQDFFSSKTWGYWQDQLVTTHPIETHVADARSAKANIDGITYAKGGAALQQLHFFVGEEAFREGLRNYFQKYAFGNAMRSDFIDSIASAAKKNLGPWTKAWLQSSGPQQVRAHWACKENRLSSLSIEQTKSSSGNYAPHRTRIGLYQKNGAELEFSQSVDVSYEGKITKVENLDAACPDFVYPNLDDKDFALFSLDEVSMRSAESALRGGVRDPLLRLMIWNTLYQMVRDGKLSPARYLDLAIAGLEKESDEGVLGPLLSRHSQLKEVYFQYLSPADRAKLAPTFEASVWKRASSSEKGDSLQMSFFDFYPRIVQSQENLAKVREMLETDSPPAGIVLDQDRRWTLLLALARNSETKAKITDLIDAETKRDPSDAGRRQAYAARVAVPDIMTKRKFWDEIVNPEKIPPTTLKSASNEFHQPNKLDLSETFVKEYFQRLKTIDWKKSDQLVEIYLSNLFPLNLCSAKLLKLSRENLKAGKNLTPFARRIWLEANDELSRCVKIGRR